MTISNPTSRSAQKHRAILEAASESFLAMGFLGASMDEIAQSSGVSKQTIYKHFGSKEALFVAVVSAMTGEAGDRVRRLPDEPKTAQELPYYLFDYAMRQLSIVLTPRLMRLRRMVVGEVSRFPDLASALYEGGPKRAISGLAKTFERLAGKGLLQVEDATLAATHFNWLVMGEPINRAMLLGDGSLPSSSENEHAARAAVRVFLAAYGSGNS